VTICGLHPKPDGLAGLLSAQSGHPPTISNAAVQPVKADVH
jgi:hypothetical protein